MASVDLYILHRRPLPPWLLQIQQNDTKKSAITKKRLRPEPKTTQEGFHRGKNEVGRSLSESRATKRSSVATGGQVRPRERLVTNLVAGTIAHPPDFSFCLLGTQ